MSDSTDDYACLLYTSTLVEMGALADAVEVVGYGESRLAVQTGDGVREPLNRRTVVTLIP